MSELINVNMSDKRLPGINPLGFGDEKCQSGYSVAYTRRYWLLHFVISGKGTFTTEGNTYEVLPSQIFVVHPHRAHCYTADKSEPWHYAWVQFDGTFPIPSLLERDVITAPAAGKIFSEICSAAEQGSGREEFVAGKIWELLSLFIRLENFIGSVHNPYVEKAKSFIAENYAEDIKVANIAKELNLDRCYFSTVFKNDTGLSPKQYLAKVRLEKAAELLAANICSVADAAELSGYRDHVNFSRMFKRHFGVSPVRYREKLLIEEGNFRKQKENQ